MLRLKLNRPRRVTERAPSSCGATIRWSTSLTLDHAVRDTGWHPNAMAIGVQGFIGAIDFQISKQNDVLFNGRAHRELDQSDLTSSGSLKAGLIKSQS